MTAPARCGPGRCAHASVAGICDGCADRLTTQLAELPNLWQLLGATIHSAGIAGAGVPNLGRHGGYAAGIGGAIDNAITHMTLTRHRCAYWATLIAAQRHLTPPRNTPAFTFLATHGTWSTMRPWSAQYATGVHDLWAAAMGITQSWPPRPEHVPEVACPRPQCGRLALYREPGSDMFHCDERAGGCGAKMPLKPVATTARAEKRAG